MPQPLLGEGEYVDSTDRGDGMIHQLRRQIRGMEAELSEANSRIQSLERENSLMRNAMTVLRRKLDPFRVVIMAIFGELDVIPVDEAVQAGAPGMDGRKAAVWESWKHKLGGKAAEFITELLVHGEMTGKQLMVATKCGQQTVYDTVAKLNKAQLLNKNGGKYSLKEL